MSRILAQKNWPFPCYQCYGMNLLLPKIGVPQNGWYNIMLNWFLYVWKMDGSGGHHVVFGSSIRTSMLGWSFMEWVSHAWIVTSSIYQTHHRLWVANDRLGWDSNTLNMTKSVLVENCGKWATPGFGLLCMASGCLSCVDGGCTAWRQGSVSIWLDLLLLVSPHEVQAITPGSNPPSSCGLVGRNGSAKLGAFTCNQRSVAVARWWRFCEEFRPKINSNRSFGLLMPNLP